MLEGSGSPDIPIDVDGINKTKQTKLLPQGERASISESLQSRDISFVIAPVENGRDTTRLEPYRDTIESVGLAAVAEIAREMPIKNVTIGVFDDLTYVMPDYGIGGMTYGSREGSPSLVKIDLDPESEHWETATREDLKKTLRHELHHVKRMEALGHQSIKTLLDGLIFETLATHYEIEGSEEEPPLYATALTLERIPALLARAKKDFESEDPTLRDEWLFGSEAMNIPRTEEEKIPHWAGYALGYYLVGEYIKTHLGVKASTLYATPSEEFIKPTVED